jgi:2,3-diaminopropionate biosynthesis protein SbnA
LSRTAVMNSARNGPSDGILSTVGHTPLVRLHRFFPHAPFQLYGKLEMLNPGGSGKDRTATNMVMEAYRRGAINPGTTVVESTSGNLGVGLAQVCAYLGLRFVCVTDTRITPTNLRILKAYGAEVEVVEKPDPVTGDLLSARIRRVQELLQEIPDSFWVNQYANENNPRAQYLTMEEIHQELGRVDFVFVATSTCGTLRGCREYVRDCRLSTKVVAVDAAGSVIFGGAPGRRLIPGHGASRVPELYQAGLEDTCIHVTDRDCVVGCYSLLRREAIFAGGSSGGVLMGISRFQNAIPAGANCVAILCDRGERYLETVYSDSWVEEHFGNVSDLWAHAQADPVRAVTASLGIGD